MANDRTTLSHVKAAVKCCIDTGKVDLALLIVESAEQRFPHHWWPVVVKVVLSSGFVEQEKLARYLDAWIDSKPTFWSCFYAGYAMKLSGMPQVALGYFERAAGYKLDRFREDPVLSGDLFSEPESWYAWHAVLFAMSLKRFDLVSAICDKWENYELTSGSDAGYLAIRAFCQLREKQYVAAMSSLDDLRNRVGGGTWRSHAGGVKELREAIVAMNFDYVYVPSFKPDPLLLYPHYE